MAPFFAFFRISSRTAFPAFRFRSSSSLLEAARRSSKTTRLLRFKWRRFLLNAPSRRGSGERAGEEAARRCRPTSTASFLGSQKGFC